MGDSTTDASTDDASESAKARGKPLVEVSGKGDIILDVTFETSRDTLKKSRSEAAAAARKTKTQAGPVASISPKVRTAYRVRLDVLKKQSKYFSNLLSNPQFSEAKLISHIHENLRAMKIDPGEAQPGDLPWISITDDDEATKSAGREVAFEDMLRIMHQLPPKATKISMPYVTTVAIISDRFDCSSIVSRSLSTDLKFKWPLTSSKPLMDERGRNTDTEQIMRQKVLVAWLLGQPMRLHQATRELITRGSRLWNAYHDGHDASPDTTASWWNLPDGIEGKFSWKTICEMNEVLSNCMTEELIFRRECILNTISSVQRHFIALYSSRARQCKLGYDSSAACDSFQLGQMIQFLVSKNLLCLLDYSPASLDAIPDASRLDIEELLTILRQCPNYQIDKHHTNCGLRIRLEPILDYLRAMLSSNVVSIPHADWKRQRDRVSWVKQGLNDVDEDAKKQKFVFTRAVANDQRLRYEGALYADKMAKALFTADSWDWTPEL